MQNIKIIRSKKRTSIAISVNENLEVLVCVPWKASDTKIQQVLNDKKDWIARKLEYFKTIKKICIGFEKITDGQKIYFFGKLTVLRIVNIQKNDVKFDGEIIVIYSSVENAQKVFNKWIESFIVNYFHERLVVCFEVFSKKVLCNLPVLKIKKMRKRWGSMSSSGIMVLNFALACVPQRCLDYVIMHELCHIKHMNHGQEFHELQAYFTPNYKEIKKELESFIVVK